MAITLQAAHDLWLDPRKRSWSYLLEGQTLRLLRQLIESQLAITGEYNAQPLVEALAILDSILAGD